MAESVLSQLQERAAAAGIELDVGDFPELDASANGDDPQAIARLVAHAVARVGDKFRFLRRFSRHLEGADKRAGLLSDIAAVTYALYKRNPDAAEQLAKNFAAEVKQRRAVAQARQAAASNSGQSQTKPQGVTQ